MTAQPKPVTLAEAMRLLRRTLAEHICRRVWPSCTTCPAIRAMLRRYDAQKKRK